MNSEKTISQIKEIVNNDTLSWLDIVVAVRNLVNTPQTITQEWLDKQMAERRAEVLSRSPQLKLGQLIAKLDDAFKKYGHGNSVYYDFCSAVPTKLDSWRGSYSELALGFDLAGRRGTATPANVMDLLHHLKESVGKTFTGYKGGDYTMTEDTPVWVDNPGECHNTAIVDVFADEGSVVIVTQYCEF